MDVLLAGVIDFLAFSMTQNENENCLGADGALIK